MENYIVKVEETREVQEKIFAILNRYFWENQDWAIYDEKVIIPYIVWLTNFQIQFSQKLVFKLKKFYPTFFAYFHALESSTNNSFSNLELTNFTCTWKIFK